MNGPINEEKGGANDETGAEGSSSFLCAYYRHHFVFCHRHQLKGACELTTSSEVRLRCYSALRSGVFCDGQVSLLLPGHLSANTTTSNGLRSAPPSTAADNVAAFFSQPAYCAWPPSYGNHSASTAAMMYHAAAAAAASSWPGSEMAAGTSATNGNLCSTSSHGHQQQPNVNSPYWSISGATNVAAVAAAVSSSLSTTSSSSRHGRSNSSPRNSNDGLQSNGLGASLDESCGANDSSAKRLYEQSSNFLYPSPSDTYMKTVLGAAAAQWANDAGGFPGYGAFPGTPTNSHLGSLPDRNSGQLSPPIFPWMKMSGTKPGEAKRTRQTYSRPQTVRLEQEFHSNHYLNRGRRQQISEELQLTERQVKIWFQNRRMKNKKVKAYDCGGRLDNSN
ncbi:hypothetical protein M3Y96_00819300 [Aphelenchoides besseyi]|nr:hypothetical protein M3Y96_00819300 [Aphelenchoides besseyi]